MPCIDVRRQPSVLAWRLSRDLRPESYGVRKKKNPLTSSDGGGYQSPEYYPPGGTGEGGNAYRKTPMSDRESCRLVFEPVNGLVESLAGEFNRQHTQGSDKEGVWTPRQDVQRTRVFHRDAFRSLHQSGL